MSLISRLNSWLAKFVGPNAAHMIDALIAEAIIGAAAYTSSPAVRDFLSAHSTLAALVPLALPPATALASKFRKAAGSQANLVDEIAKVVEAAVAKHNPAAAPAAKADTPTS